MEIITENSNKNLCLCGCGTLVKGKFVSGHYWKFRRSFNDMAIHLCECGCSQETTFYQGKWRKFVQGHNRRNIPVSQESKDKQSKTVSGENNHRFGTTWSNETREKRKKKLEIKRIIEEAIKEVYKEIKYCECGCGIIVKNRFVQGHNMTGVSRPDISKLLSGTHLTDERKKKISESNKGKNEGKSPSYKSSRGKGAFCNKGFWTKSTYETKIANHLYLNAVEFYYEPKRFYFETENGRISYLPDFYIPHLDLWIECKGWMNLESQLRIDLFRKAGYKLLIIDKTNINNLNEVLSFLG